MKLKYFSLYLSGVSGGHPSSKKPDETIPLKTVSQFLFERYKKKGGPRPIGPPSRP